MRLDEKPRLKALLLAVAAAAALAVALPAPAGADDCPDAWITAKVKSRLLGKKGIGAFKINIDTEQCVVTLNGCVDSQETREKASAEAGKVNKVREVRNNLTLCPEKAKEEKDCPDAVITAEVKSMLMGTTGFSAFKINIDTEQCVVTLNGCVDTREKVEQASKTARKAKGVREVRNKLTICPE